VLQADHARPASSAEFRHKKSQQLSLTGINEHVLAGLHPDHPKMIPLAAG
jgi:hypothetical protein